MLPAVPATRPSRNGDRNMPAPAVTIALMSVLCQHRSGAEIPLLCIIVAIGRRSSESGPGCANGRRSMSMLVEAVHRDADHSVSKRTEPCIRLLAGLGVEGDAHLGATVQHRSRVARDPTQPNLRQVHLIHAELLDELRERGFAVLPGAMGENITTRGLDLLALPAGARPRPRADAMLDLT